MPEGPEIRRAADRIANVLQGQSAVELFFAFPDLKPWEARLRDQRVRRVEPRGKALLIGFEPGVTLYTHNQLYGRWFIRERGLVPETRRQLRVAIHTDTMSALLYSASEIAVLADDELRRHPYLSRLGPDPLDPAVRPSDVRRRLQDPAFARRTLGALLLDQSFLCGVGNYLRSEILHYAAIAPSARPADLEPAALMRLARAALTIPRRAYRMGGVTNDPGRVCRMRRAGRPRQAYRHYVFGRAGESCARCGDIIGRRTVAGRRLYRCPVCQPSP